MYYNLGAPICKLKITQSLPSGEFGKSRISADNMNNHCLVPSPRAFTASLPSPNSQIEAALRRTLRLSCLHLSPHSTEFLTSPVHPCRAGSSLLSAKAEAPITAHLWLA